MSRDSHLQDSVLAALAREPSVTAEHIGVTVADGLVTLAGSVASLAEKHAAEAVALRVRGVSAVIDELEVQLPYDARRSDEELALAITRRLAENVLIPSGSVKPAVEDGFVTLAGEVDWHYQRDAADLEVRRLTGVAGLSNDITLRSKVSASNISDDIMHALHRSWFFDPQTVTVREDGGIVWLSGTVRSPHDRQVAIATAWTEPGVTEVEADIQIG